MLKFNLSIGLNDKVKLVYIGFKVKVYSKTQGTTYIHPILHAESDELRVLNTSLVLALKLAPLLKIDFNPPPILTWTIPTEILPIKVDLIFGDNTPERKSIIDAGRR